MMRVVTASMQTVAAAVDAPLSVQVQALDEISASNPILSAVFEAVSAHALPAWYIGAGAITQTVWNLAHEREPQDGIKDYDVAYFDASDLSEHAERRTEVTLSRALRVLAVKVDAKNQARVHLWYKSRFGVAASPLASTEAAIATWPTTASSVGVRRDGSGVVVCAPFGLRDLFSLTVRPNRRLATRTVYEEKTTRWAARWPRLSVQPW